MTIRSGPFIGILALSILPTLAWAADTQACTAEVTALSNQLGLPNAVSAESGASSGVITPPATGTEPGTGGVIKPPASGSTMPVVPILPRADGSSGSSQETPTQRSGALNLQIQGLLDAALAADRQGDESLCQDRLSAARKAAGIER